MMITTVTLSPAIDQTIQVNHFKPNTVNRGQAMQYDPGGKGVNVAAFLADAGFHVSVTGFLGSENPTLFEQLFVSKGIADDFIRLPGCTRTGIKIVDEASGQTTDINLPSLTPIATNIVRLLEVVDDLSFYCDWFVMAGNLPPQTPTTIYATMIERLKARGKKVVLDTSHAALRAGVQAGPTIVKPNVDELSQLVESPLIDEAEIEQAARHLLGFGVELVVVSMGEKGALFVNADTTLKAIPPTVPVKSTVGAGDAMVAGLVAGQIGELSLTDTARLASAYAAGKITRVGPHLPPQDVIKSLSEQVVIRVKEGGVSLSAPHFLTISI